MNFNWDNIFNMLYWVKIKHMVKNNNNNNPIQRSVCNVCQICPFICHILHYLKENEVKHVFIKLPGLQRYVLVRSI